MKIKTWLLRRWPLVTKTTCEARRAAAYSEGRREASLEAKRSFDIEREKVLEPLRKHADALTELRWSRHRPSRFYQLAMQFDPAMFAYGGMDRDQLRYIAEAMTRRMRHEIETAKFIRDAEEERR